MPARAEKSPIEALNAELDRSSNLGFSIYEGNIFRIADLIKGVCSDTSSPDGHRPRLESIQARLKTAAARMTGARREQAESAAELLDHFLNPNGNRTITS